MALKVLHVEDDAGDAELVEAMLRRAGLACDIVRAETREQFVAALEAVDFDLILVDHSLPKFDGISALAIGKEKCPAVPFIFVSGKIGEEAAIECMKRGATDYVLKQKMSRLVPAVRRALDEAAERRKRERAENMLRTVLEAAPNGVVLADARGQILLINPKISDLFGYEAQELMGQSVEVLMPERYRERHVAIRSDFMVSPQVRFIGAGRDFTGMRKDGSEFPVEIGLNPVRLGGEQAIIASIIDITERKRAEESLRERVQLAEFSVDIGNALARQQLLRPMLQTCAEIMVRYLDVAFARIWTLNPEKMVLEMQASAGMYTHIDGEHSRIPVGRFKIGMIAQERKPHLTNAVIGDPRVHDQQWARREGMVAFAGYPLLVEDRLVGVMAAFARKRLSDALVQAMASVANGIAVGIERKFAEERARRNYERIRALHEIDTAISSTLELKKVLELLLEKSALFFPDAASHVRLFNKDGVLERVACYNLDESEWKGRHRVGPTLSSRVVATGAPLIVRNIQTSPQTMDHAYFRKHGLVAYLGVPLTAKAECVGVLGFYAKRERQFTAEEIEFASTLAGQAAIAIHNAQLYEQISVAKNKLESTNRYLDKSLRQLSGLYTALTPLTSSEVDRMLDGIIARLLAVTGADAALIRLKDEGRDRYRIAGQQGFPDSYLQPIESVPSGGATTWVFNRGESIIAPDIAAEPRFTKKSQLNAGIRSAALLPLKVHGEVRAVVHLASRALGYFDEEQRHHLGAIARQMSVALENRELFDRLRASNVELARANNVKDEFLGVISHELRTPLNVIIGYTGLLKDGMLGGINAGQVEALRKVYGRAGELLDMINQIIQTIAIEASAATLQREQIDVCQLLDALAEDYELRSDNTKNVALLWEYPPGPIQIDTDAVKVKQILRNLINNALKFTDRGNVTVSLRVLADTPAGPGAEPVQRTAGRPVETATRIEFRVTDTGIGIAREMHGAIFNKFQQVDSSVTRRYEGLGLGLYVVKTFTDWLGGKIELESEMGKGSTFMVTMPSKR